MTDVIDGNGTATGFIDANIDTGNVIDGNDLPYVPPVEPPCIAPVDSRQLWLESLDGSVVVQLNTVEQLLLGGATGLELPPLDVVTATTPGMPGSWLQEINVLEREVFLPLEFASESSHADFLANLAVLRGLIAGWDTITTGQTGTFRLVAQSVYGQRVLDVTYKDGWTGSLGAGNSGPQWEKIGLTLVAVDPYWRDRNPVELRFTATQGPVFLGDGDNTNPWPRQISASTVIGNQMKVLVDGDVPVWPEVELDGPVSEATVTYPGTNVSIPTGVVDGQTFLLVSDPRARSARLNGAVAWSKISLGATVAPLMPGVNTVNVEVGTSGTNTGLVLRWTPGHKSSW
jgi:hypothetical protein